MRVNVYAEELTDRVEIVKKVINGQTFTGVRFYLELPVSIGNENTHVSGPFIHKRGGHGIPDDDDSSAVTFWGKRDMRSLLRKAKDLLDVHYGMPEERD